ncbi:MAG: ferrous iron transporter B, partial [Thermoplasmata archaeon]|nr:ferrous iron transporter B [Thermoplasmata archaeon]
MMKKIRVALAGNPNVGKTTIFNKITGAKQHVGNWPGVTVEKKVGHKVFGDYEIELIDLPGTYSLSPYSIDEVIARDYIIEEDPDVVVHVVDATNMERNLYFTTQLMEHEARVVIALNMSDLATEMGDDIDIERLSEFLEIPIIPTTGSSGEGIDELLREVIDEIERGPHHHHTIGYGRSVEKDVGALSKIIESDSALYDKYPTRWLATKLLEGDKYILDKIKGSEVESEILEELSCIDHEEMELFFTDKRYEIIGGILPQVLKRKRTRISKSDMIDHVLTNKYLGIPIFLALMWGAFELTFSLSVPFMDIIDRGFSILGGVVSGIEPAWLGSLLGNGIIGGVGFVIIFVPV